MYIVKMSGWLYCWHRDTDRKMSTVLNPRSLNIIFKTVQYFILFNIYIFNIYSVSHLLSSTLWSLKPKEKQQRFLN